MVQTPNAELPTARCRAIAQFGGMGELNQRGVVRPLRGNPPGVDGDRAEVMRSLYCRRNTISPSRVPFSGCCSSGMCSCTVPALATCASSLPLPWAVRLSQRPPVRVRYLWRRALPLEHAQGWRAGCGARVPGRHERQAPRGRRRQRPPLVARLPACARCHHRFAAYEEWRGPSTGGCAAGPCR